MIKKTVSGRTPAAAGQDFRRARASRLAVGETHHHYRQGVTHELINLTGGRNLRTHIDDFNRDLSMEEIMALNPEVILIWGSAILGEENSKMLRG